MIDAERYMGLFHTVAPKEKALTCNDCHSENGVMDWASLGYEGDPQQVGARVLSATSTNVVEDSVKDETTSNGGLTFVVAIVIAVGALIGFIIFKGKKA